jgi:hypothetical protein
MGDDTRQGHAEEVIAMARRRDSKGRFVKSGTKKKTTRKRKR